MMIVAVDCRKGLVLREVQRKDGYLMWFLDGWRKLFVVGVLLGE